PGSLERLSTAEIGESKGYVVLELAPADDVRPLQWEFRQLPARPMIVRDIPAEGMSADALHAALRGVVDQETAGAVLRVRVDGELSRDQLRAIAASRLRAFVPESMNLEIRTEAGWTFQPRAARRDRRLPSSLHEPTDANLRLDL